MQIMFTQMKHYIGNLYNTQGIKTSVRSEALSLQDF